MPMEKKKLIPPEDVVQLMNEEIEVYVQHNTREHPTLNALLLGRDTIVRLLLEMEARDA